MTLKYLIFGLFIILTMLLSSCTILAKDNAIFFSPATSHNPSSINFNIDNFTNDGSLSQDQLFKTLNTNETTDTTDPGISGYPSLNSSTNVATVLPNTISDYQQTWEAWASKAAIRVMITSPDQQFLIIGTGYLLDNSIKVYRYNDQLNEYVHVTDLGDGIIHGDVVSLAWGDTDHNNFPEIIAGSADGYTYVFEQTHIYDPKTNLENNFELVWKGPYTGQVWGVALADTDLDYLPDVITGAWDGSLRWYEYTDHSGYPFTLEHWINYGQKFMAVVPNHDKITSIQTGDINGNGLPDVVVGTWSGAVYIYENNGTDLIVQNGKLFPLAQDNSYKLIYSNTNQFWNPITRIVKGNLDTDPQDEFALLIPGQGVFTLDYDNVSNKFYFNKLVANVLPAPNYELGANSKVINTKTVDFATNTYVDFVDYGYNIFGRNNANTAWISEPNFNNYGNLPYNTSLAFAPDGNYTAFGNTTLGYIPAGGNASAVADFGFGQEVTGDGRVTDGSSIKGYDLQIILNSTPNVNQWDLYISKDEKIWFPIPKSDMANGGYHNNRWYLVADTDPTLNQNQSLYYRYLKMVYYGPNIAYVDSVNSTTLARALTQATAIGIGHIDTSYFNLFLNTGMAEPDKLMTGTSDGKLYVHEYDPDSGQVHMVYDFYGGAAGDRFNLGANIWDIVQVKNTGTLPTWFAPQFGNKTIDFTTNPYFHGAFYSETYAHLNAFELFSSYIARPNQDLIVTNNTGGVFLYYAGTPVSFAPNTNYFFSQVNNYYQSIGNPISLAFGDSNKDNFTDIMVATSWNQVVADPLSSVSSTVATLHLWRSFNTGSSFSPFSGNIDLTNLETTGSLKTALQYTQAKPSVTLVDLDGDGDLDIVFTNGHVYVIWNVANYLVWRFDANYFSSINANMAGRLYYAPTALDVDLDGDMDLIFSYALTGNKPRYGAVYYRNDGMLNGQTVWTLQKGLFVNPIPSTNLAFNNFTSFAFTIDYHTGKIINMTAYSNFTNALYGFKADYISHDNFIVSTDPVLYRVEINLRDSPVFKNFGYRIAQTWSTESQLNNFTQSIQTSDLDHDGRGELVVGDYDNNMYIFEYLTSGLNGTATTYKIAYKSPNLVQHQTLSQSPYAADQLAGLKGNFTRTLWQNAKFVMAGVDLNNNGRQEVVVTAGLSFYVFELDPAGNDLYDLIYMQDLHNSIFQPLMGKYSEFTALGGGTDSDYNGRGEIMLAIGPALFIFEYAGAGAFEEIYAGYPALGGRYFSVGNPVFANFFNDWVYKNLVITSIAVGDVNNDNYQDIVVGGYYQQPFGRLDGSLTILENKLGTIVPMYEFSPRDMQEAPINDIKLADQDYDRNIEILVANDKGVDIWEYKYNASNPFNFEKVGQISSSMNHPIPSLNYLGAVYSQPDKTLMDPSQDLAVVKTGFYSAGANFGAGDTLNPGDLIEVASFAGKLVMAYSKNDGKTWKFIYNAGSVFLTGSNYLGYTIYNEYDPSIIQLYDGSIGIAFMADFYFNFGSGPIAFHVVMFMELSGSTFSSPYHIQSGLDLVSPTIFLDPNATTLFSVAFIASSTHTVWVAVGPSGPGVYDSLKSIPNSIFGMGDITDNATYLADRIDVAYYPLTDMYVMAFSGRIYNESKPDVDVFTSVAINNSLIPIYTSRVSFDSTQDRYPSISVLQDNHSYGLVIVYQEEGIDPGFRIMASHSKDIGRSWTPPEPMNRVPDYLINICFTQLNLGCFMFLVSDPSYANKANPALHPGLDYADTIIYDAQQVYQGQKDYSKQTTFNASGLQFYWVTSIITQRPAIAGRVTGGFAYSFSTNIYIGNFASLLYRIIAALTLINDGKQNNSFVGATVNTQQISYLSNDRLVSNTLAIGKIATIAVGVNPNSEFIKFDLGKALQIDTGDTDGDGRKEIVIASNRGVFLNELSANGVNYQIYDPIWEKTDYPFAIHDVALGDTNHNGFDEIFVAGEKGNVFAYEMVSTSSKVTDFDFTKIYGSVKTEFINQPAPTNSYQSLIKTIDINGDGIKDMIYPSLHDYAGLVQRIYAVDGKTGTQLWNYNLTVIGDEVTTMTLFDYNGDGKPDVVVGTQLGVIYVINSQNGQKLLIGPGASPVQKIIGGNFNSPSYLSFAFITGNLLLLYDPFYNSTSIIHSNEADSNNPGYFTDITSTKVKSNSLLQILSVTSHGIARVFDFNDNFTSELVYTLNNVPYGQNGTIHQIKDFITSVATYDLKNDGLNDMFVAINSTIFAFDNTGKQLWNKTDLTLSRNLDKLTVVHDQKLNRNILTLISYSNELTFEDYQNSIGSVYNNYTSQGVVFGPSWEYWNSTGSGYPPHSGNYVVFPSINDNSYIEFNVTQQYVSFYLDSPSNYFIRVIGLNEQNQTVYLSNYYNSVINKLVVISLTSPLLKRIMFEGIEGFINYFTIDDLKYGGTDIFAFNALNGDRLWNFNFIPTQSMSFNPNVDTMGNLLDNIVGLAYIVDPMFSPDLLYAQGLLGLNIETGTTEFFNDATKVSTMSGVSLGQGLYAYLAFNQTASDFNYYTLYTISMINSTFGTTLPYHVQNSAVWQINTNKLFTNIITGQLDSDPYNEMITYNNRLIAAIDNNGHFLWKYVTAVNISQVLLANFNKTGIDIVVVLLTDDTILVLNSMFGAPLNSQTLPFFIPVKMMAVDFYGNGSLNLVIAERNPTSTAGILLNYKYRPLTYNFSLISHSLAYAGAFKDVILTCFDNDHIANDYLLYFDSQIILLKNDFTFKNKVVDSILAVTAGDYNGDSLTEFAYINASSYLVVRKLDLSYLSQKYVSTGLLLLPGMNALYSMDMTGDNIPEIIQYQFGKGYALYKATSGALLAFWQDRVFFGGFLGSMDIDFDGYNELILRNERLAYAIKYNSSNQELYTTWSSPLSLVPIITATTANLTGSYMQLVFMNMFGQIFAVEGIFNPLTHITYDLRFNYQSKSPIQSIDTLSWQTTSWLPDLFDGPNPALPLIKEIQDNPDMSASLPDYNAMDPFIIFGFTFLSGLGTVVIMRKNLLKTIKSKSSKKSGNIKESGGNQV